LIIPYVIFYSGRNTFYIFYKKHMKASNGQNSTKNNPMFAVFRKITPIEMTCIISMDFNLCFCWMNPTLSRSSLQRKCFFSLIIINLRISLYIYYHFLTSLINF